MYLITLLTGSAVFGAQTGKRAFNRRFENDRLALDSGRVMNSQSYQSPEVLGLFILVRSRTFMSFQMKLPRDINCLRKSVSTRCSFRVPRHWNGLRRPRTVAIQPADAPLSTVTPVTYYPG